MAINKDINMKALNKTIALIKKSKPENIVMGAYSRSAERCETAYCVAGYVIVANIGVTDLLSMWGKPAVNATEILSKNKNDKLTNKLDELFHMHRCLDLNKFDTQPANERKAAMLEVLTHFKKTGEVNWQAAICNNIKNASSVYNL